MRLFRFASSPAQLHPRARQVLAASLLVLSACLPRAQALDSAERSFDGQRFRVVNIDLTRHTLGLHWRDPDTGQPYGSIDALRQWGLAHGKRLLFAANAGIYDRKGAPLGLFVQGGHTRVPLNLAHGDPAAGNFSLRPNGVFAVYPDGHAAVRTTEAFKADGKSAALATQSGPMLVIDGKLNPQFDKDSTSMKWRSGVCARTPTQVVFAVSETPVNFDTFARLFRDALGCRNALYLDGTISQFYVDGEGYSGAPAFMLKPYAGIFAVFGNS